MPAQILLKETLKSFLNYKSWDEDSCKLWFKIKEVHLQGFVFLLNLFSLKRSCEFSSEDPKLYSFESSLLLEISVFW